MDNNSNLSAENLGKLKSIADSDEGKQIKELLSGSDLEQAAKRGDIGALKSALSAFLQTDAGAKLANQLNDMMK